MNNKSSRWHKAEKDKKISGKPRVNIDWNKVNQLLIAGCSGAEIAGNLGVSADSIYRHCETEFGIKFSDYSRQFYKKGDSLLRAKQYDMAMKGDRTLAIWLGKQRLKQYEKQQVEHTIIEKESEITQGWNYESE